MKITGLNFNCRSMNLQVDCRSNEYIFIYMKTPSVLSLKGNEKSCPENTAVICSPELTVNFKPSPSDELVFDRICFRMNQSDQQYLNYLDIPADTPLCLREDTAICSLMKCLQLESFRIGEHSGEFLEYGLRMMLINISSQIHRREISEEIEISHFAKLQSLRRKIYAQPVNKWEISRIAEEMNISRSYFHRIYSKAFGVTFMQDVINSRLAAAADMLTGTNSSVSYIAEKCGYDSDSYFMRQFRKHYGCTPTEYRRRCIAENGYIDE